MRRILLSLPVGLALAGCAAGMAAPHAGPAPATAAAKPAPVVPANAPETMRWLYGSGEGAAASIETFRALADYAVGQATAKRADSVILAEGASPDAPRFVACGTKPRAVVFDVDETLLQNLGFEYWQAATGHGYDPKVWDAWERTGYAHVAPMPGAVTALRRMRAAGLTMVFNTNRSVANADPTAKAIDGAGLGPAVHGETLFLKGDDAMGSAKDGRRATIAARYCVVAMAGDNLGDFSDRFNDRDLSAAARRRMAASGAPAQQLWGQGWFLLSNPVYGPSLGGDLDTTFPPAMRWLPDDTGQGGN